MLAMLGQVVVEFGASFNDLGLLRTGFDSFEQQARQCFRIMGTENDIDMTEFLLELISVALADATSDGDIALGERGSLAKRKILHGSDLPHQTLVCLFPDAASDEDTDIGFLIGFDRNATQLFKHTRNLFGVMLIHLAAESRDAEGGIAEHVRAPLFLYLIDRHAKCAARLDCETDGSAIFPIDDDVRKARRADDFDSNRRTEAA